MSAGAGPGAEPLPASLPALAERLLAAARRDEWEAVLSGLPALVRARRAWAADPAPGPAGRAALERVTHDVEALLGRARARRDTLAATLRATRGHQRALAAYAEHD